MNDKQMIYPFTALVGQENMKLALILNVINPALGGVLIRGEKGTAKSTAVRALADVLPSLNVVDLPISATEDQVVGSLDIEQALKTGEKKFEPGLLAKAHKQILYIDEINLLDDHIVDVLLDAAAMGVNTVEREGISYSHPARFVLVGTMNPEEGDLRPQLLDRFALSVEVRGEQNPKDRVEVVKRRLSFDRDPVTFTARYIEVQQNLANKIMKAKKHLK
ncbi:MAG: AAA family ATPase [Bacillaceae bacterium]|nr:AAA family ATPase [Bacillaceae bacterium]